MVEKKEIVEKNYGNLYGVDVENFVKDLIQMVKNNPQAKIAAIKEVRGAFNIGLKEAKGIVESVYDILFLKEEENQKGDKVFGLTTQVAELQRRNEDLKKSLENEIAKMRQAEKEWRKDQQIREELQRELVTVQKILIAVKPLVATVLDGEVLRINSMTEDVMQKIYEEEEE